MNCHEEQIELNGYSLRRYIFCPSAPEPIRGAAVLFHGQGDFSERYGEVLQPFISKGIACVATDLPGHGRSEGARGHVPGLEIVDRIAEVSHQRCQELCNDNPAPPGILGHSAGGLLALRELLRRPGSWSYSWVSSPLLHPAANQHPLLVRLTPLASRLLPRFTVATGVTQDRCTSQPECLRKEGGPDLFHSRVSTLWGHVLIRAARWVGEHFRNSPPRVPLLITQGLRDRICSALHLRALLTEVSPARLTLREFPEALHEPFFDECREDVSSEITNWLERESIIGL